MRPKSFFFFFTQIKWIEKQYKYKLVSKHVLVAYMLKILFIFALTFFDLTNSSSVILFTMKLNI